MSSKHSKEEEIDWNEYKRLILDKLDKLDSIEQSVNEINTRLASVDDIKERVIEHEKTLNLHTYTLGKLKTKCSIWGTIGGFFASLGAILLYLFFGIK